MSICLFAFIRFTLINLPWSISVVNSPCSILYSEVFLEALAHSEFYWRIKCKYFRIVIFHLQFGQWQNYTIFIAAFPLYSYQRLRIRELLALTNNYINRTWIQKRIHVFLHTWYSLMQHSFLRIELIKNRISRMLIKIKRGSYGYRKQVFFLTRNM